MLDRKALADCYEDGSEGQARARAEVREVLDLKKKLQALPPRSGVPSDLADACFQTLVWAHYWETGLADANHNKGAAAKQARAAAALYQATRYAYFGKSQLEQVVDAAKAVSIYDLLSGKHPQPGSDKA